MIGETYGRLTIVGEEPRHGGHAYYRCVCECGEERIVCYPNLKRGTTKSCGCLRRELLSKNKSIDLTNKRFGKLVCKYPTEKRYGTSVIWHCECDCGGNKDVAGSHLNIGLVTSCGCRKSERGVSGEDHYRWNGGTPDSQKSRIDWDYMQWRKKVLFNSNYLCQICGSNRNLVPHHLAGWAENEEQRYEVENGVALCQEHHLEFHKTYGFGGNTRQQFEDFILRSKKYEQ